MVQPRNDLSSDDDYDSRDEHEPCTKAHQCRMIKTVVLDSLKDFKNLRVMMIVIMLDWILARCGLQQDSSPSTVKDRRWIQK
jgi:hypothetical protein